MNILVFLAGVSVGWAADKLYSSYIAKKTHLDEGNETLKVKAEEKDSAVKNIKKEKTKAKKSETEKESLTEKKESSKEIHDDLSQLNGVGPKLAEALDAIGIYNYEQLSESPVDLLLEQLRETGGRFSRPGISIIIERAKQAAKER